MASRKPTTTTTSDDEDYSDGLATTTSEIPTTTKSIDKPIAMAVEEEHEVEEEEEETDEIIDDMVTLVVEEDEDDAEIQNENIEEEKDHKEQQIVEEEMHQDDHDNGNNIDDNEKLQVVEPEAGSEPIEGIAEQVEAQQVETENKGELLQTAKVDEVEKCVALKLPTNRKTSDSEESCSSIGKPRPALIRGRKSIKELKEAIKEELNNKLKEYEVNQEIASEKKLELEDKKTNIASKTKLSSPIKEDKIIVDESKEDTKNKSPDKDDRDIGTTKIDATSGDEANMATIDATPTCRLTRKSAAHELAVNTRITRNRQNSSGSLGRPETPPTNHPLTPATLSVGSSAAGRPRRSITTRKVTANALEVSPPSVVKRKRSVEDHLTANELVTKHIKMEAKDDVDMDEDEAATTQEMYNDFAKVKQELSDGGESTTDSAPIVPSMRGRPRGRKSQTPTIGVAAISPSTRSTRHTKVASESPTFSTGTGESKRRRTGAGNTMTRSSVNLLKSYRIKQVVAHAPDEDSKESLDDAATSTSSSPAKVVNNSQSSATENSSVCEEHEAPMRDLSSSANGVSEPLTVETNITEVEEKTGEELSESGEASVSGGLDIGGHKDCSEKAASLSPNMVSEGVNVMSVKQFYKKAEFLENNLGIEEDPKLGEIVQKGTTTTPIVTPTTVDASETQIDEKEEAQIEKTFEEAEATETEEVVPVDETTVKIENVVKEETDEERSAVVDDVEEEEDEGLCGRLIIQEEDEVDDADAATNKDEANAVQSIDQDISETNNNNNKETKNECDNIEAKLKTEDVAENEDVEMTEVGEVKDEKMIEIHENADAPVDSLDSEMKTTPTTIAVEDNKESMKELIKSQDDGASNESKVKATHLSKSVKGSAVKSNNDCEQDEESLRRKETHLKTLGLLTHKAAEIRRLEYIQSSAAAVEAASQRSNTKRNGKSAAAAITIATTTTSNAVPSISASATEYTGTLKTVIKLNRNTTSTGTANGAVGGRKSGNKDGGVRRQPLKMTFQKGRGRGQGNTDRSTDAHSNCEDAYYTIQNEVNDNYL